MKKTLSIFLFISFFSFAQNDSKTQLDITYLLEQNIN